MTFLDLATAVATLAFAAFFVWWAWTALADLYHWLRGH